MLLVLWLNLEAEEVVEPPVEPPVETPAAPVPVASGGAGHQPRHRLPVHVFSNEKPDEAKADKADKADNSVEQSRPAPEPLYPEAAAAIAAALAGTVPEPAVAAKALPAFVLPEPYNDDEDAMILILALAA